MQEPSQQNLAKSQQIKLRASCDTCFLAKVKCSKARPVCSRCLACGADCNYSPSRRAGKRKSLLCKADRHIALEGVQVQPNRASKDAKNPNRRGSDGSRDLQGAWITSDFTSGISGGLFELATSSFMTSVPLCREISVGSRGSRSNDDFFNPFLGWVNPTQTGNTSTYFDHVSQSNPDQLSVPPHESLNPLWGIPKGFGRFPSPPPELFFPPIINSSIGAQKALACRCFNSCLQTLQKLYDCEAGNLDTELILAENHDAIATCSKMLRCPTCTPKGLSQLQATILATIMSNLLSTFQRAWNNSLSTFHRKKYHHKPEHRSNNDVIGEDMRWLQARDISRNLMNLDCVFSRFQELLGRGENDRGLSYALACQIEQSLRAGLEGWEEYKDFLMQS